MIKTIDQIIGSGALFVIISFSLIYWTKKRELDKPKYLSFLISLVLAVLIFLLYQIFEPSLALVIVYFVDAFLGAFLISILFKTGFIDALKFLAWLLFVILILFYFIILAILMVISWIIALFV
ncbi:MAG: hypothetical protein ACTSPN_10280 [Promethearchaeota archaeon]